MLKLRTIGQLFLGLLFLAATLPAQPTGGTLRGVLTDNSGAVIPSASISLNGDSVQKTALSQADGSFSFAGLAPGAYTVKVSYPGFGVLERNITIKDAATVQLPLQLAVQADKQSVTVLGSPGPTVSVEPDNNATAMVVKGADLDALPDDPDDLNDMLQSLAGPAAGPDGGQLFVDGFSGGRLPPKSSIREIRINQNPFSAEYDRLGMGRIEILTKPGTDKFRGDFGLSDSDAVLNTRNPYVANKADFSNRYYSADVSGPLGHRASFFVNFDQETTDNDALINAVTLDPKTLVQSPVRLSVVTPQRYIDFEPRIDYQLSTNHTLTGRYDYYHSTSENNGIGQYNLASRAYSGENGGHTVRLTETAVLNSSAVNETRFGYDRNTSRQYGDNSLPSINVSEAFGSGGAQVGRASRISQHYELQNNTSIGHGRHTFRFGVRVRRYTIADNSPANFGGSFTFFGVGNAPVLTPDDQPVLDAGGQPVLTQISSLEQYRRTLLFQQLGYSPQQIRNLGGGASQFSISGGNPLAEVSQNDVGLFAQDDWRTKPNLTISLGLRYETQTNIHNWTDFAPRIGVAWSPKAKAGKPQLTVIRAGLGVYYDRVNQSLTLQQLRFNGLNQQQFLVMNPDFYPNVPALATLQAQKQPMNTYRLDPNLRSPYMLQSALSIERQLPRKTTLAVSYLGLHALHQLRTVNLNAPLPDGVRPYGDTGGNPFYYESNGVMNQNMLSVSINTRFSSRVSLNWAYQLMAANSDVDGNGFPSNPYDFKSDYGRSGFARHQRGTLVGNVLLPFGIRVSPNLVLASGPIYNLTTGHDLNGDTIANDRPAFATDLSRPSVVFTRFGAFDTNPMPGQTIVPRNYLTGTGMWNLNMRVARNFAIWKVKGAAPAAKGSGVDEGLRGPSASLTGSAPSAPAASTRETRMTLNLNVFVNNVFNHVTQGGFVGNLSSPLFGQATGLGLFRETSNCRKVQLGMQLSF